MLRRRFSFLEKILFCIIFVFIVYFLLGNITLPFNINLNLPSTIQIPNLKTKESLENRYKEYVNLQNNKKYSSMYRFLSKVDKENMTESEFIALFDESKSTKPVVTTTSDINSSQIRNNVGYIDRTATLCYDQSCSDKISVRGYKKLLYEDSQWKFTNIDVPLCIREQPYDKSPEFSRALSLIEQRVNSFIESKGAKKLDFSYFNCLDIQYADLDEAEGVFLFKEKNSDLNKLLINVDTSYKENDDILTAFLLSHEVYHASSYLNRLLSGYKLDCVEDEVQAFVSQILFGQSLNTQERNSVEQRFKSGYGNLSPPLRMSWDLATIMNKADAYCGNNSPQCYNEKLNSELRTMVIESPYYQKQCGL